VVLVRVSVECQRVDWKDHKIAFGKKLLLGDELDKFFLRQNAGT
jgi:hypothetical protein